MLLSSDNLITMRRKVLYFTGALLLLLIITNPGLNEFKSFLHQNHETDPAGRETNFFIFSIYSNIGDYIDSPHNGHMIKFKYVGILGNFYAIGTERVF